MAGRYGYDEIAGIIVDVLNDREKFSNFGKEWAQGYACALVRLDSELRKKEKEK